MLSRSRNQGGDPVELEPVPPVSRPREAGIGQKLTTFQPEHLLLSTYMLTCLSTTSPNMNAFIAVIIIIIGNERLLALKIYTVAARYSFPISAPSPFRYHDYDYLLSARTRRRDHGPYLDSRFTRAATVKCQTSILPGAKILYTLHGTFSLCYSCVDIRSIPSHPIPLTVCIPSCGPPWPCALAQQLHWLSRSPTTRRNRSCSTLGT